MSAQLFQWVGDCFMLKWIFKEMHCLGAVSSGSASPQRAGSCGGGVLGVVRALGVLVSEGRVQGPPKGYKEGPHCAAPLQSAPNNHVCEKDNYLCDRYVILVREIADRVTACSYLCVEVLLCTDCPCGLAKATCKDPLLPIPPSISIGTWQQSSEMLLEYWYISVVPSKGPEMMNNQSLYQAVRSRLHFSQVAAWWSRSKGAAPSYITTRVVSFSEDNLRKFRETPSEHTFPLSACGDGNSIKVTVWALPRVEDVPVLSCPIHPLSETEDEGTAARALTPTKNSALPLSGTSSNPEALVLPTLVDDRLQTPCTEPGKHHCRCEEEDTGCPPSPSIQRANGERKRRRSLPRGPDFVPLVVGMNGQQVSSPVVLSSVCELVVGEGERRLRLNGALSDSSNSDPSHGDCDKQQQQQQQIVQQSQRSSSITNYFGDGFKNDGKFGEEEEKKEEMEEEEEMEERDDNTNVEKRYKKCNDGIKKVDNNNSLVTINRDEKSVNFNNKNDYLSNRWEGVFGESNNPRMKIVDNINWTTRKIDNGGNRQRGWGDDKPTRFLTTGDNLSVFDKGRRNVTANPFGESSPFHESNPGPSTNKTRYGAIGEKINKTSESCCSSSLVSEDLSKLMTRMKLTTELKDAEDEDRRIFDWISKVPGRVFGGKNSVDKAAVENKKEEEEKEKEEAANARKKFNSNLELSQREFDEVLAVLRARTPAGRRRTPMQRLVKRRERLEKQQSEDKSGDRCERRDARETDSNFGRNEPKNRKGKHDERVEKEAEGFYNVTNKADVLLGAILRSTGRERKGISDISNGARPRASLQSTDEENKFNVNVAAIKPYEDEAPPLASSSSSSTSASSSSSLINKRINRFKQLFAKDQNGLGIPSVNLDESKAKRRINFSEISSSIDVSSSTTDEAKSSSSSSSLSSPLIAPNSDFSKPGDIRPPLNNNLNNKRCTNLRLRIDDRRAPNGFIYSSAEGINERKNSPTFDCLDNADAFDKAVPSAIEQERFRRSLGNAASMVFHSRTGLPLTSSPAPLRRGSCCFDYDSSLNTVSSKRSALFELNTPPSPGAVSLEEGDREAESTCEGEGEGEGEGEETRKRRNPSRGLPHSHALLGSFEESALNGRLEPVSTVHGFTAELGASGSFCPKHRKLPVTVFFYTLGDNDKVSTPYLAHINLGKKGYQVPRSGTIQVTLLNPLGTVVKMFVVMYDLSDMPSRSHTFLRQRTLRDKTLRYLIHLRFMSGKSGRIYLHTDIRMIICRKSDVDTASDLGAEPPKELRSFVHGPTNPKFSPRC